MQVTIEKPENGLEHKMKVTLPAGDIEKSITKRLNEIRRTMKMDGFRPGKVHLNIVKKHHGAQVRQEIVGDMVQRAFYETVEKEKLNVAGYPRFESLDDKDDSIEFVAKFETFPEITLPDFATLEIEQISAEITDADVDNMVTKLREQKQVWKPANDNKKAVSGNQVIISFVGKKEGVEFDGGKADDVPLVLGSNRMIPGFEDGIIGMKKGEQKVLELTFPEDYQAKELAGQAVTFDIEVHSVQTQVLPEVDEEFVKGLGIDDGKEETLMVEIRTNMEKELSRAVENKNRTNVLEKLSDAVEIDIPKSILSQEASTLMQRQIEQFQQQGLKAEDVGLTVDDFIPEATRRVKLGLILDYIIKVNKIKASEESRKAFIAEQASSYEDPQEVINWYAENPDSLREIDSIIVEKEVANIISAKAKIVKVNKTFNEVINKTA
ncbi:MAG TPA: trigger factor [Thiomicrospira sp.]|nr:trigger factor [Thiomicrospira sp.]